eukprot:5811086-Pyramimonas_sp.AAC.1
MLCFGAWSGLLPKNQSWRSRGYVAMCSSVHFTQARCHRLAKRPSELPVVMPAGPESELAALDISLNLSSARCAVKDQTRCCTDCGIAGLVLRSELR